MAENVVAPSAPRRFGWYYGWTIVGLSVLTKMMAGGLVINCFSLFLLDWRHDLHASVSTLQLAMGVFAVVGFPFCVLAGWAADRFPIRWVLAFAILIMAVTQAAIAFSHSAWTVVALYILVGVGVPFASVPPTALVSRWFVKRRGLALGISAFGATSAGVVFPPIIGVLMHAFGWRMTWGLSAAFLAVVIVPLLLMSVRDRPGPGDASGYLDGADHQAAAGASHLTYRQIVTRPNFWCIGVPFLFVCAVYMSVAANLQPLVRSHGLGAQTAVLLLSAFGAADLISKLACGAAADRFGTRAPMVTLCLIGMASAMGLAFAQSQGLLIASLLGMGMVGGILTLVSAAVATEFGRESFGRAFGLITAFSPVGTMMPWVLALTQERTGSYRPGLIGLAVLALLAAGLATLLRERRVKGRDPALAAAASAT